MSNRSSTRGDASTVPSRLLTATVGVVPPQAALFAGALAVLAVVGVAGIGVAGAAALGGVIVGALLAGAIATIAVDRPIRALVGGIGLLITVGAALGGPVAAGLLVGPHAGGAAAGGVLVGFGVARFRLPAFGAGAVGGALAWLARLVVVVSLAALLVGLVTLDRSTVVAAATGFGPIAPLVSPTTAGGAMIGFVAACWLAYGGVWLATVAAPVSSLLTSDREARVTALLSRLLTVVGGVLGVGSVLVAVVYAVVVSGSALSAIAPVLAPLVESSTLRLALLQLAAAGGVVAVGVTVLKAAGANAVGSRPTWLPSALAVTGTVIAGVTVGGDSLAAALTGADPTGWVVVTALSLVGVPALGLFVAVGGLIVVGSVLAIGPVAATLGVLPARTAGPRLVLFGVTVGSVSAALGDAGVVRPLLGVAAGVVAWDIAAYGVDVTADVGPTPARRDGAVVHGGASLLVGLVGVVGAGLAYAVLVGVSGVVAGSLLTAVAAVAALAVFVLLYQ